MITINPTISIVVPVYKAEPYIRRCINSILAQTFTNFELLLVDDGSPDNCPAICDEYAAKDSRVRVIHKANGGVSSARNAGLDDACGKYIMFCDSDDYVDSNWCQELYSAIAVHPTSCVVANLIRVKLDEMTIKVSPELHTEDTLSYYEMFSMGLSGYIWNKIYDHLVLDEHKIRFNHVVSIGEDVDFNVQYHQYCDTIIYISKPLYYHRDNPISALNSYHADWLKLHLFPFYVRVPLIDEEKLSEYCDGWLYTFINYLDFVFDKRNSDSFFTKLRYNQRMLNTKEFQFCLVHATGKNENPLVIKILKTKNYYLYWLFQTIVKAKRRIKLGGSKL